MKDLSPCRFVYAVPESITFTPMSSVGALLFRKSHLLDKQSFGAGDELCFVRAALGARAAGLFRAGPVVGRRCCDDFSAHCSLSRPRATQHWWEMKSALIHRRRHHGKVSEHVCREFPILGVSPDFCGKPA
jgi:hypothetical protein